MFNEVNSNEFLILAGERFTECLTQKRLPSELSPAIFTEALLYPKHFPVIHKTLQLFGESTRTTYQTEWDGTYLPNEKQGLVLPIYHDSLKKTINTNVSGDKRFWALCLGHANGNEQKASELYTIMQKSVAPKLGYKTGFTPTSVGDYQLVFDWMAKNLDKLKPMFLDDPKASQIDRLSAMIGLNGEKVSFDPGSANVLLHKWGGLLGNIDVESATVKKPKLDPEDNKMHRAGSTSVTKDFESIFILADSLSDLEYGEVFGIADFGVSAPSSEIRETFRKRTGLVQLLLLTTLKDKPVIGRQLLSGDYPLKQIADVAKVKLPSILKNLQEIATMPPIERNLQSYHHALDQELGNQTQAELVKKLISDSSKNSLPGYGTANALLMAHCEAKLTGNTQVAGMLEKLMLYATRIATDPHTIQELGLDKLIWE